MTSIRGIYETRYKRENSLPQVKTYRRPTVRKFERHLLGEILHPGEECYEVRGTRRCRTYRGRVRPGHQGFWLSGGTAAAVPIGYLQLREYGPISRRPVE
jgi:hypothetical protein